MENSIFSSPSKKSSLPNLTAEDDRSSEESGWTEYLADFSAYNRGERDDEEDNNENSSFVTESMVSDAGSGSEWRQRNSNSNNNNNDNNHHNLSAGVWSSFGMLPNLPKKLNFKKKRAQEISYDDSLEDTASSPITINLKRMDINSKNMDEHLHNHMAKGITAVDRASYNKINEAQEITTSLAHAADCIELKNKGLCLVPLSMVMDNLR